MQKSERKKRAKRCKALQTIFHPQASAKHDTETTHLLQIFPEEVITKRLKLNYTKKLYVINLCQ